MAGQKDSLSPLTENIKCSPMKIMHTRIQLGIIYFDNLSFLFLFFFLRLFCDRGIDDESSFNIFIRFTPVLYLPISRGVFKASYERKVLEARRARLWLEDQGAQ